jgi:hypothetical protein
MGMGKTIGKELRRFGQMGIQPAEGCGCPLKTGG